MPAIRLFGRRWHFSTDIVPLPASLALVYHFPWIVAIVIGAAVRPPHGCGSWEGVGFIVLFSEMLVSFALSLVVDVLLFYNGMQGAPFEESKRHWVVPLLYAGTVPLVMQLVATAVGTWIVADLSPDCWSPSEQAGVANFARVMVFINFSFVFLALVGVAIFCNAFPDIQEQETWEQRCACIATLFCCRQKIESPPDKGKRPPLKNIAQLAAGFLGHTDLEATDIAAAAILTGAAQKRRRRLRIAKALLPVFSVLRETSSGGGGRRSGGGSAGGGDELEEEEDSAFSADAAEGDDFCWIPSDPRLTRALNSAKSTPAQLPPPPPTTSVSGGLSSSFTLQPSFSVPHPTNSAAGDLCDKLHGVAAAADDQITQAAAEAAAESVAGSEEAPEQTADQIADAIAKEVERLGEGPFDEAVLSIKQQESLDLANLQLEEPAIWFHPEPPTPPSAGEENQSGREAATVFRAGSSATGPHALPLPSSADSSVEVQQQQEDVSEAAFTPGGALQRAVTLHYPTIITPSRQVEDLTGLVSIPAESLTEIYAGRHAPVRTDALSRAQAFLRYAYAVYSLEPESRSSFLDMLCFGPPDPADVVTKAMGKMAAVAAAPATELLYLNSCNRVLAHLPYMIALDHDQRAVVIALRGTFSIADLVTDAVVHPEPVDDWLPGDVAAALQGRAPALAHAGMVGAARAVFQDMRERGILEELMEGETAGEGEAAAAELADADATQQRQGNGEGWAAEDGDSVVRRVKTRPKTEASRWPSVGERVGNIMRCKIHDEGWRLVVTGHSLGAGAAALVSLKLRRYYPNLECIAFSCPGGLVSKHLAHAMQSFCTTVVVGKDAVPRATVSTVARLVDELITALARCKQPKMWVLFVPWWRRPKQQFKDLFYGYDELPEEAAAALRHYYESRRQLGQPVPMFPPGKIVFIRPMKTADGRNYDAVYISPEDLISEGILLSSTMLRDHLLSTVHCALEAATKRAQDAECRGDAGPAEPWWWTWPARAVQAQLKEQWGTLTGRARMLAGESLEESMITAV